MTKNRYSKLLGNSALFAIANLGTKMMQFLMVPLYTYALTRGEFGTVDLLLTTVTMLTPVITMSIFDAVFRYVMDGKNFSTIFSNGLMVTLVGLVGLCFFTPVFELLKIPYSVFFSLMLGLSALNSLLQNFARAAGFVRQFAFSGLISAVAMAALNVYFLVFLHSGIQGYLWSTIIAAGVTTLYLVFATRVWRFVNFHKISWYSTKKLLRYSLPLIPNAFSWWFTTDANRYFILVFIGAAGNGLYAVGNKIPSILTVFFSIFTQAWQLSAVEEFESNDKDAFYTKIFNALIFLSVFGMTGLLIVLKPFMSIYTSASFYGAWRCVPFLLLAAVYANLSGFVGTIFLAAKKTNSILSTTILGMILNVLFNLLLIPWIGINGAGVGSSLGFLGVIILRLYNSRKFMKISLDMKSIVLEHLVLACMIAIELLIQDVRTTVVAELLMFLLLMFFERKYLQRGFQFISKSILRR